MTSKEKICKILKEIKDKSEISPDPNEVSFDYREHYDGEIMPEDRRDILYRLEKDGFIKILNKSEVDFEPYPPDLVTPDELPSVFKLKLLEDFNKKYQNYCFGVNSPSRAEIIKELNNCATKIDPKGKGIAVNPHSKDLRFDNIANIKALLTKLNPTYGKEFGKLVDDLEKIPVGEEHQEKRKELVRKMRSYAKEKARYENLGVEDIGGNRNDFDNSKSKGKINLSVDGDNNSLNLNIDSSKTEQSIKSSKNKKPEPKQLKNNPQKHRWKRIKSIAQDKLFFCSIIIILSILVVVYLDLDFSGINIGPLNFSLPGFSN